MKINGQHIQGIFLYRDDVAFESGDFVIYDEIIYICTPKDNNPEVIGIPPDSKDGNYTIYLGDKIISSKEYFDYLENPQNLDKYVTAEFISEILSNYMIGFNEKGIISEYIDYSPDTGILDLSKSLQSISSIVNYSNILDVILRENSGINNAIFRVSRNLLPDLPSVEGIDVISELDKKSIILKQYTYIQDSVQYKVQEIIDPVNSIVSYRYGTKRNGVAVIAAWKKSTVNDNFLEEINLVKQYYEREIESYKSLKSKLANYNFRYRNLNIIKGRNIEIQTDSPDRTGYVEVDGDLSNIKSITISIQELISSNVYKNNTINISLEEVIENIEMTFNIDDWELSLSSNGPTMITIDTNSDSRKITNIYYQYVYKDI